MVARQLPSREYLMECFSYDEGTGLLTWKTRPCDHFEDAVKARKKAEAELGFHPNHGRASL